MKTKRLCAVIAGCGIAGTAGLLYLAAVYKPAPATIKKEELKYEFQNPECIRKAQEWKKQYTPEYFGRNFSMKSSDKLLK